METESIRPPIYAAKTHQAINLIPSLCSAGYYVVVLWEVSPGDPAFGRQRDDFSDGMLIFCAPYRVCSVLYPIDSEETEMRLIAFSQSVFEGMWLEKEMGSYTFFNYRSKEALHLSMCEKQIIEECMDDIESEMWTPDDRYRKYLLSKRIELLLDYGMRFYERQFITRWISSQKILRRYESIVEDYIERNGFKMKDILPLGYCSRPLGLSEAYLDDLLKQEKGISHEQYMNRKGIEWARKLLLRKEYPLIRIAFDFGFSSVEQFDRFFRKAVGCSAESFRYGN